ncbi:MAG: ATP-binding protein [Gallionella sp.]
MELHIDLTEMLYQPHESKPWNPWIAKVFYRRGLIETLGRGTLKIAGLMQEAGLQAPTLQLNADFVTMPSSYRPSRSREQMGAVRGKCRFYFFTGWQRHPSLPSRNWHSILANQKAPSSVPFGNCVPMETGTAPLRVATGSGVDQRV